LGKAGQNGCEARRHKIELTCLYINLPIAVLNDFIEAINKKHKMIRPWSFPRISLIYRLLLLTISSLK
jgi:hypothetical protein